MLSVSVISKGHLTLPVRILDYNSISPYPADKKLVAVVLVYQNKTGRADTTYSTNVGCCQPTIENQELCAFLAVQPIFVYTCWSLLG